MSGVGQPPEDAHDRPVGDAEAEALAERRARRDLPAELDRLRARVGELEEVLEEERALRRALQTQLDEAERTIADVRTGAMELALRLTSEQDARKGRAVVSGPVPAVAAEDEPPADAAPAPSAPEPPAADEARPVPDDPQDDGASVAAAAAPVADPETASLIEGLQRAAERLRTQVSERDEIADDDEGTEAAADEPEAESGPAKEPEPAVAVAPEPVAATVESRPEPVSLLVPRRQQAPAGTRWIAESLDRLVAADRDRAAAALTALIPAQAPRSRRALVYDLAVVGTGTWRVRLQDGAGTVGPLLGGPASDRDIDFVVSGPPGALVPLAAGGARRRLSGTLVTGRRRRLRKLLRDLRAPLALSDLVAAGTSVDPAVLLELLALMVEPAWTGDHAFTVDYDVTGEHEQCRRVAVGDGVRTGPAPDAGDAEATVTVPGDALAALLAGIALPAGATATVTGSADAVGLLHGWFDQAQGVSA